VVIGAMILATFLTLLVLPSIYFSLERIAERWAAARGQEALARN
jgi:Cu/Ag efflux pump CusA